MSPVPVGEQTLWGREGDAAAAYDSSSVTDEMVEDGGFEVRPSEWVDGGFTGMASIQSSIFHEGEKALKVGTTFGAVGAPRDGWETRDLSPSGQIGRTYEGSLWLNGDAALDTLNRKNYLEISVDPGDGVFVVMDDHFKWRQGTVPAGWSYGTFGTWTCVGLPWYIRVKSLGQQGGGLGGTIGSFFWYVDQVSLRPITAAIDPWTKETPGAGLWD